MDETDFLVAPGRLFSLKKHDPGFTGKYSEKIHAEAKLQADVERLSALQDILYASQSHALLILVQAMDAAGKDSLIKHVMTGLNPQGCTVHSFKEPSTEELRHDFLWRAVKALPERGMIGIFNRSYYEEVLVVRVHPELLRSGHIEEAPAEFLWKNRFEDIRAFERHLTRNGTVLLKFFLNVSREEQRKRFLERLTEQDKHWKFSPRDIAEREHWDKYMTAYEDALRHTSTPWAPWHVLPADHKWFTRLAAADIVVKALEKMKLRYPVADAATEKEFRKLEKVLRKKER